MLFQVKRDRAIKHVTPTGLDGYILEADVFPSHGGVHHHADRRIIELVVNGVQEHEFAPELLIIAGADQSRDVQFGGEDLEVFEELFGSVLGVQDAQFRENAHMRPLQPYPGFEQLQQLIGAAFALVKVGDFIKLFRIDNDVEAAELSQTELLFFNACVTNLLPRLHVVGLARCIDGVLEFLQTNQRGSEAAIVRDVLEEDSGGFV
mmetsp:Transcript_27639/g.51032  ORF Transcript_27639/g.51032 Transcript_27639/m.51032 type:complete len:206 (-) Transcript_27639:3773-4390(-)